MTGETLYYPHPHFLGETRVYLCTLGQYLIQWVGPRSVPGPDT